MMLKNSRRICTTMRASSGGPLVTCTSGICRRKCWTSPRPCSSTLTTSVIGASAGTSSTKRPAARSIRLFASSAISRSAPAPADCACGSTPSDLVPLKQLLADHHALDLRGALSDQQQWGVAVEKLDLVLLGVAVAAVDAKALLDAEATGLGGEQLGHPRLEVRANACVLQARRAQSEQPGGVDLGGHVGELELDRLVLCDRLAERLALLGVAQSQLQGALGDADAACGDI